MYHSSEGLRFSPTDLIVYLEGEFGSWMDRWYLEQRRDKASPATAPTSALAFQPDGDSEEMKLIKAKGLEHEKAFLQSLKAQGYKIIELNQDDQAASHTLQAMRNGAQVIYQASVEAAPFRGYADFLNRQEGLSSLGTYHYEVWDTKLAKTAKPYFVIQLCAYAEMLEVLQGRRPEGVEIVLGTKERRRFRTNNYFYYYRCLKNRFLKFQEKFNSEQMPHPGFSLGYGRWSEAAESILAESDHLIGVARLTRTQVKRLEAAGIATIAALAASNQATITGIDPLILTRLRKQAQLQIESRGKGKPVFEVVAPLADDPRRGLALLPPPSPGDVFFDMEGYPLADGGLEYLFGAAYQEGTESRFADWWAHDLIQEKTAFVGFVTWAHRRWKRDPNMHIYHYAAYEPSALRRLMGKFAACEAEVDELLRNQVFVDLYTVVRQGVVVGTPSYSLKDVERAYMRPRTGSVTSASGSIIAYQAWLESEEPQVWQASPILRDIRDYNQLDCDSTFELAVWLRTLQATHKIAYLPEKTGVPGDTDDEEPGRENPSKVMAERLLKEIEDNNITDPERRRVQELLAWLLEFHWREAKPVFWLMFARHDMTEEELSADLDCLGGLQRTKTRPILVDRSRLIGYRYNPDQDTKLGPGSKCFFAHDLGVTVTIETMDRQQGLVQIRFGPSVSEVPDRLSLIPNEFVSARSISDAVYRYVEGWSQGQIQSQAVDDLIHRRLPRIKKHGGGPVVPDGVDLLPALTDVMRRLDHTTLCIQGPPGSGKTFTAAHVIAELLRDGRRIGVMASSHKAILNLMEAIAEAVEEKGITARLVKVGGDADEPLIATGVVEHCPQNSVAAEELGSRSLVLGGTAWLFSRPELEGRLDYLFVDEAGQVSLANIVGSGLCAINIILVGDQMQLSQPTKGSHPGESGLSALDYLLQGHATIPPDLGVFLRKTYRMHPEVCEFISQAVYEGRLKGHRYRQTRQFSAVTKITAWSRASQA